MSVVLPPGYRVAFHGPLVGDGCSNAIYVQVWGIAKADGPYCVANEVVCGEIGRFLGLPIPVGAVVRDKANSGIMYTSLDFNLTGQQLPPIIPKACAAELPDLSTGLLLFDCLVGNADRHKRNLAVDDLAKPTKMSVFDHGHALLGDGDGDGIERLLALQGHFILSGNNPPWFNSSHCLLDHLTTGDYFFKWTERIKQIPDWLIDDLTARTLDLGISLEEAEAVAVFLKERKRILAGLIHENQAAFKGIAKLGLILP